MNITITAEDPGQPDILAMLQEGEDYAAALYPAESNHFLSVDELRGPNVHFLVARDESGTAIGTGAVALNGDWAEIKRMWIDPAARGRGLSKKLLTELEETARANGARELKLETGIENHEALALYARVGFTYCKPFANYVEDPLSVFMVKPLSNSTGAVDERA